MQWWLYHEYAPIKQGMIMGPVPEAAASKPGQGDAGAVC